MARGTRRAATAKAEPLDSQLVSDVLGSVVKVSHTLEIALAEKLREFAFRERISESSVIEHALNRFFMSAKDNALGNALREGGAGKRRKS